MRKTVIFFTFMVSLGTHLSANEDNLALTLKPFTSGPGVEAGIAEVLTDITLTQLKRLPGLVIYEHEIADSSSSSRVIEGTVWKNQDEYVLTIVLYNTTEDMVVLAQAVELDMIGFEYQLAAWIEAIDLNMRTRNPMSIAELLLEEGAYELAWQYYLQAHSKTAGKAELSTQIRSQRAAELALQAAEKGQRFSEVMDRYFHAVVLDPAQKPEDRTSAFLSAQDDLQMHRTRMIEQDGREIQKELEDTLRNRGPTAARVVLNSHQFQTYEQERPYEAISMREQVEDTHWQNLLRQARAYIRRDNFTAAHDSLERAILIRPDHPETHDAIVSLHIAQNSQENRRRQQKKKLEWDTPRAQRDTSISFSLNSPNFQDSLQYFQIDSIGSGYSLSAAIYEPFIPYARYSYGLELGYSSWQDISWRGFQFAGTAGIAASSELLEAALSARLGLDSMASTAQEAPALFLGPAWGIEMEVAVYIPHLPFRVSLHGGFGRVLWLPTAHWDANARFGLKLSWTRGL